MKQLNQEEKQVASQLKARLWLSIAKIVEEEVDQISPNLSTTPTFVASLVELVYNQLITLGEDLESFARHGQRKTILPDDLMMVVRKNGDLMNLLKEYITET